MTKGAMFEVFVFGESPPVIEAPPLPPKEEQDVSARTCLRAAEPFASRSGLLVGSHLHLGHCLALCALAVDGARAAGDRDQRRQGRWLGRRHRQQC